MIRICANCEQEGQPALLGEKAPFDDPTVTHGICDAHAADTLAAARALFAGLERVPTTRRAYVTKGRAR